MSWSKSTGFGKILVLILVHHFLVFSYVFPTSFAINYIIHDFRIPLQILKNFHMNFHISNYPGALVFTNVYTIVFTNVLT